MKKFIYCLPLLLLFITSCNEQCKTQLPNDNEQNSKAMFDARSLFNIPWADPALLFGIKGC